jgi:putative chitinase
MTFIFLHLYHFLQTFTKYEITTPLRIVHFLAQLSHESGGFKWFTELGNKAYFNKYDIEFNPAKAKELGNTQKGDGYKFRGRGLIQLTGRANYAAYKAYSKIDVVNHPELASKIDIALDIAGWYWWKKNINAFADNDDVIGVTKKVNGGTRGLEERKIYVAYYKSQKLTLELLKKKASVT